MHENKKKKIKRIRSKKIIKERNHKKKYFQKCKKNQTHSNQEGRTKRICDLVRITVS